MSRPLPRPLATRGGATATPSLSRQTQPRQGTATPTSTNPLQIRSGDHAVIVIIIKYRECYRVTRPSQTPAPAPATPVTRSAMKTTADPGTDRVMVELGQQEEAKHEVSLAR